MQNLRKKKTLKKLTHMSRPDCFKKNCMSTRLPIVNVRIESRAVYNKSYRKFAKNFKFNNLVLFSGRYGNVGLVLKHINNKIKLQSFETVLSFSSRTVRLQNIAYYLKQTRGFTIKMNVN